MSQIVLHPKLTNAIAQASYADIEEIVNAFAERWGSLPNHSASRAEVDTVACPVGRGV